MCSECGCGSGGTGYRINGKTPAELHGTHDHPHDHGHDHDHAHPHDHGHEHPHDHVHEHSHAHDHAHEHSHAHDHVHEHSHAHDHVHEHSHAHDHGHEHSHAHDHSHHHHDDHDHAHAPLAAEIVVTAGPGGNGQDAARANRARLAAAGVLAVEVTSLPGAGKTGLIARAVADLDAKLPAAAILSPPQSDADSHALRAAGARTARLATDLDAAAVSAAIDALAPAAGSLLLIEGGAGIADLGTGLRVALLSVTDGDDKAEKYPDLIAAADLLVVTKSDLVGRVRFDVGACLAAALRINPHLQTLVVSAETGNGIAAFVAWLEARAAIARAAVPRG